MSSREPLWYCHECRAEMRPMMVPDPHCASCNGTFVEKMENPEDDPRDFRGPGGQDEDNLGPDDFLFGLQNLLRAPGNGRPLSGIPRSPPDTNHGSGFTLHINRSSTNGPRTMISGGPVRRGSGREVPLLSEFVSQTGNRPRPASERDVITGPLMLQYLLSMMQQPGRDGPMAEMFGGLMPQGGEQGRWGDYVFNQEALDQIITQIMENSAAHPVPATDEIMEKLPREVLEEGSSLLDKDCAVCKEQFKLGTEDPDEQIIVTLPCKHPFHESCIMPWLKSSGTCPVCRFQLIPQPEHHAPGPGPPSGSSNNNGNGSRSPGAGGQPGGPGGFFDVFMNHMRSGSGNPGNTNNHASNRSSGGSRVSSPRRSSHNEDPEVPGGWHYMD